MSPFAAPSLPHMRFDSRAMASPELAFEHWRGNLSQSWEMSLVDPDAAPRFHAEVSMWKLQDLLVGSGSFGPAQTRMRRERNIRADQLDHYRILFNRAGWFHCDADGTPVSVGMGRFLITDMALPEYSESACQTSLLYIPRDLLDEALPYPVRLHGLSPDSACAGMLGEHLAALLQTLPSATPQETAGLAQATLSLVAASLTTCPKNAEGARPAIDSVLLRRARKHVEQHLCEEALSVGMLCAQLRVSRSTLYRLFEPLGGVSQYIKERRLARIHELLSGASERPQIARLAEDHGFKSAAHFSKSFRDQFGYSAREVPRHRAASVVGGAHSLDRWLGALRH